MQREKTFLYDGWANSEKRRQWVSICSSTTETIEYAAEQWIDLAQQSISSRGQFCVALSGGSTPLAIFQRLLEKREAVDWSRVLLFWSDERNVRPTDSQSNYRAAMEAGFKELSLRDEQIHPLPTSESLSELREILDNYQTYSIGQLSDRKFDLIMLGVGEDGHIASLFPKSEALSIREPGRWWVVNPLIKQKSVRLTMTFWALEQTRYLSIYALGQKKAKVIESLFSPSPLFFPVTSVGTEERFAHFLLDKEAGEALLKRENHS